MSFFSFSRNVGIDLGTSQTRIYIPYRGVIFDEPSKLAFEGDGKKRLICVGECAEEMVGRAPNHINIHTTVSRGAIQDEHIAEKYLHSAIRQAQGILRFFRSDILISVPTGATSMEQRAAIQTCKRTGARSVFTEQNAILAAFGVGMHRDELRGRMVTDIGAGLTETAVISLGGMSSYRSERVGGNDMDTSIVRHIQQRYHLLISENVARQVKEKIGTVAVSDTPKGIKVKGSDMNNNLPRIIHINSNDVAEAIQEEVRKILDTIASVFQGTRPELTSDILEKGVILTGGVANLNGLDRAVEKHINAPVQVADHPEHAVIRGIGKSIQTEHLNFHRQTLLAR